MKSCLLRQSTYIPLHVYFGEKNPILLSNNFQQIIYHMLKYYSLKTLLHKKQIHLTKEWNNCHQTL
jgi:hypothetical protein